ncbi:hypothetical protein [Blastopirellula retiformator]|uniref:Uncharacterized protein n=1 Tax=Blastopirellula retiformator TaxID=2527970 RepID=A0A5C5UTX5_9BACT|nr:hypothetical protein [Blastopirellula retiformator]TWT29518.1 hypothetical protein Enr8_50350 [Blastopirellula retiformator]
MPRLPKFEITGKVPPPPKNLPVKKWESHGPQKFECSFPNTSLTTWHDDPLKVRLFKIPTGGYQTIHVDFGAPLHSEVYIREHDLVFTGEERENVPVRSQAYVRAIPDQDASDLILSRQTSLLDFAAPVSVEIGASGAYRLVDGQLVTAQSDSAPVEEVALAAPINDDLAICLLVFPGDADAIVIEPQRLSVRSFVKPLEKGVIRQVRVRALLAERAGLAEFLAQTYATFRQSELPLTT